MSVWRRFFGVAKPPQREAHHALSMVMLPEARLVSGPAVLEHLASEWGDLPSISGVDTSEGTTVAAIPGGALALAQMPGPIPSGDLDGPVALAWHWPQAAVLVATHRNHLIVHVGSTDLDLLDLRLFHTKLIAATLAVSGGVGVYVGDAMMVRSAEEFIADARSASRDEPPILSWVGFNGVGEADAISAYTTGLSAFGRRELEVRRTSRPWADIVGTLADLASYQLVSGRSLRDGDTFGATESDRTRIRFAKSEFIVGTDVAVLELT